MRLRSREKMFSGNKQNPENIYIRCLVKKLEFDTKELIKDSEFVINFKEKTGFIGRNGSGKSTLINLILAKYYNQHFPENIDFQGDITITPDLKIAYLPQEVKLHFEGTVGEYIDYCGGQFSEIFKRFIELSSKQELSSEESLEYQEIIEKMGLFNLWDYDERRKILLEKMGFTQEILQRRIQEMSGGEATKIALLGVLISDANFWLLDEPTNNLDNIATDVLFEEIKKFKGGVLMVTHDRRLLNILSKIIEIDEETKKIRVWGGNYNFYKQKKKEEYQARWRKYEDQERRKKQLRESALQLKQQAEKFEKISKSAAYRAVAAKLAKRYKVQMARIKRELTELTEPKPPEKPKFPVPEIERLKGNVLTIKNLEYILPNDKTLKIDFLNIEGGDRLLIRGPNGSGKTTLLRIILGEIKTNLGEIYLRPNIKIGYLPQTPTIKDKEEKVVDFLKENYNLSEDNIKQILNRIKTTHVFNLKLSQLSIGEIRRLQLGAILFTNPQLLILDEPTNHLDVYTIEELVEALINYQGTIIFVSHDEEFIKEIKPNKNIKL